MARVVKTADESIAALEAAFSKAQPAEKTIEDKQREEATEHATAVLAKAVADLNVKAYTGEAHDIIGKTATALTSALRNTKDAIRKQADPSVLPGVKTQEPTTESAA